MYTIRHVWSGVFCDLRAVSETGRASVHRNVAKAKVRFHGQLGDECSRLLFFQLRQLERATPCPRNFVGAWAAVDPASR